MTTESQWIKKKVKEEKNKWIQKKENKDKEPPTEWIKKKEEKAKQEWITLSDEAKEKKQDENRVKKAGGGMTRQGLYPAEMARAGTMSQAKRKRYMKKGGKITYRMTGGQVLDNGYD